MAEGLFTEYAPEGYEAISAGTQPSGNLNPLIALVMREIVTDEMIRNSSVRVNMGCMERKSCPTLFINNVVDWNIDDPKGKSIDQIREIRNVIDSKVKELVTALTQNSTQNIC